MKSLIGFLFTLAFLSCHSPQPEETAPQAEPADRVTIDSVQQKMAGIETGLVEKRQMNAELRVNGVVDVPPQNIVSVSFPLGGYLKSTELLPGMHINRGQVIARIEDPSLVQLQQDYLVAEARLKFLEKEFERQKILTENEVSAAKVFQQTEAEYQSQKIIARGLGEKLRLININPDRLDENTISRSVAVYSPINGYVSRVNVNIGKYVNPADVLFELINPGDMHAALTVFEKDLPYVKPGQKVKVSFVENAGKEYDCEVLLVTKNVDDNRSALVHCHFETQPEQLLPGMFLNARIQMEQSDVWAVPEEAVVRYGESEYLFDARGENEYRMVRVNTGIRQQGMVAVQSDSYDLNGKRIVTRNAYSVLSKLMNTGQ